MLPYFNKAAEDATESTGTVMMLESLQEGNDIESKESNDCQKLNKVC